MKYLLAGETSSHASLDELVDYHIKVSQPQLSIIIVATMI